MTVETKTGTPLVSPPLSAPPQLQAIGIRKVFGSLVALDNVSLTLRPGTFHALLGGNGAGKSTLVKCIMGYYQADAGEIKLADKPVKISNPRQAKDYSIGMVYQHFTLVQNMTVAENLVLSRGDAPMYIDWAGEKKRLVEFMKTTPFHLDVNKPVRALAAGEKQKLEILKQLYLRNRILFLDEPTSVLTPQEADEVLGMLKGMTESGDLSVLMITHKFREVMKFADEATVLRTGKFAGRGMVRDLTPQSMAEMMIGSEQITRMADRNAAPPSEPHLQIEGLHALDETGVAALADLDLTVRGGEIVGIAGVSGNGQSELVEVLAGQRRRTRGNVRVHGKPYMATRSEIYEHKMYCLPEEPLKNTCVPGMTVAQNMAFRTFDRRPFALVGYLLNGATMRRKAEELIKKYRVKTPGPDTPIRDLSGGNVQRAVLARELSGLVEVLVAANPCFGLDFAATADIRAQIMAARNRGAAVLLVSEDLDEVFELSDRIVVMFDGKFVYETPAAEADISVIGRYMAGHGAQHE
jgi:ABC-type uncharacterized transport system ATPase subunit